MASSKDMPLHASWRVFADVGPSPKPDDMFLLGTFETALGFWKFWNGMGDAKLLDKLPVSINLRMFRNTVRRVPDEQNYIGVSFLIEPATNRSQEVFVLIAMAVVGEQLTSQVNAIIFRRVANRVSITVWAETDISEHVRTCLNGVFDNSSDNYNLEKKVHGRADRSAIMVSRPTGAQTATPMDTHLIRQYASDPDARVLPQDLASFDWDTLYSLSRQFDSMNLRVSENRMTRPGAPTTAGGVGEAPPMPWDDAHAEAEVHRWLGQVERFFAIRAEKTLPYEYHEIITAEGCPVCFRGHDPTTNQSYVTLRCLILQCQHVLHWNCLSHVPRVNLRHYHSTAFFRNDELSHEQLKALQAVPHTCARGSRRIRLELQVHHLLSSQCDVTIPGTSELETYTDAVTRDEFALILFGRERTLHFPVRRARVVCKVVNTQTNQTFEHDVNYDIPLEKQQNLSTNQPFRMVYTDDDQSRNSLVVCVQREIVMQQGNPTPRFAIMAIQYVFSKDSRLSVQVPGAMTAPVLLSPVAMLSPVGPGNQVPGAGYGLGSPYSQPVAAAAPGYPPHQTVPQYAPPSMPTDQSGALSPMGLTSPQMNPYQIAAAATANPAAYPQYPAPPNMMSPASAALMHTLGPDQSGMTSPVYIHQQYHNSHVGYGQARGGVPPPQVMPQQQTWNTTMPPNAYEQQQQQHPMQQQQYDSYNEPKQSRRRDDRDRDRDRGDRDNRGNRRRGGGGFSLRNFFNRDRDRDRDRDSNNRNDSNGRGGGRVFGRFRGRGRGRQAQPETPDDKPNYPYNYPTPQSTGSDSKSFGNGLSPHTPSMIDHVVGRVYYLAKSQSGSRFVQEKLSDPEYFEMFLLELRPHVADLMMDNFGHYAIEALFNQCDDAQRLSLLTNLTPHMATVACHKQGSFSIQAMMENLTTDPQVNVLSDALKRDIRKIILNNSGHYVILRFLQRYEYPHTKFIHRALTQYTLEFATDHYGLRVMKTAVDTGPTTEMNGVFNAIVKLTNTLVENQYGNYIVQHLLDIGPSNITDLIKEKMHGKFVRYSKQKFSSNVVEKCLRHSSNEMKEGVASKDWRALIVHELLGKAGELISDKYGNYCLQTALQASKSNPELLHEFKELTKPHLASLRENVRTKWIKLLQMADEQLREQQMMTPYGHGYPPPATSRTAG